MSTARQTVETPPPPQAPEAEERLLGALLLAGGDSLDHARTVAARIRDAGLDPGDFYRESHARIYRACLALLDRGDPPDPLLVIAKLDRAGELEDAGGRAHVQELAAIAPATANTPHYAGLIRDAARQRELIRTLGPVLDAARNGGCDTAQALDALDRARHVLDGAALTARFAGLAHQEALALKVTPVRQLVAGLVEAGSVGTIAGLPETHKSFLALDVATAVAASRGRVLGRDVVHGGPVAVYWQDDSTANQIGRVQDFAQRRGLTGRLPIRWHFNEGLRLPDDIPALRAEAERDRLVLVVLDSLYNLFGAGIKLKDEDVGAVLSAIKAGVCDPTGCAVAIVDHAPWPTEGNRGQRRAYGSVFKAASVRWSIFLERDGDTLWAEGRGNNLPGLKRTLVIWDESELALRVIETPRAAADEDLAERVADFVRRNPGAVTAVICAGVRGTDAAIKTLLGDDERFASVPAAMFGQRRNAKCWALVEDVPGLLRGASSDAPADMPPTSRRLDPDSTAEKSARNNPYVVGGSAADLEAMTAAQPADIADA